MLQPSSISIAGPSEKAALLSVSGHSLISAIKESQQMFSLLFMATNEDIYDTLIF